MNPAKHALTRLEQIQRAQLIACSLGIRTAARYLYLRRFSLEAALWILL